MMPMSTVVWPERCVKMENRGDEWVGVLEGYVGVAVERD